MGAFRMANVPDRCDGPFLRADRTGHAQTGHAQLTKGGALW